MMLPAGTAFPECIMFLTFPSAIAQVEMSTTIGASFLRGIPMEIGLPKDVVRFRQKGATSVIADES